MHLSGVCHFYMAFGVVIEELCPSPLLILFVVPFGTYLNDGEDIGILVEFASCLCKSEMKGFVIIKVFEYLNNVVGDCSVLDKIEINCIIIIIIIRS